MSKSLASNWTLVVASTAVVVIVGGLTAPHVKRLLSQEGEAELGDRGRLPERAPEQLLHA